MKDVLKRVGRPLVSLLLVAMIAGAGIAAASVVPGHEGGGKLERKKKHRGKKTRGPRGKRGKRGPRGLAGPAGAPGAPGPAGTGIPFSFVLNNNAPTSIVFNGNGVRIEAGCPLGALDLIVRPEGSDHNIVQVTSFDNTEGGKVRGTTVPEAAVNERIPMLSGGSAVHDYNGLLAVRTLAGQMTTVQWWAMGSINASQGDCVGGGTVSPH